VRRPEAVEGKGKHPVYVYAERVNELLHAALWSTWFYRHEIYEVPKVVTALLITYDDQRDDAFVYSKVKWKRFLLRMSRVKKDWVHFSLKTMKDFSQTDKTITGWEGRTIYFMKGTSHPDRWTPKAAEIDTFLVLQGAQRVWGPLILEELKRIGETIPPGHRYFRDYENQVRVIINFLFLDDLSEAKAQVRTEPGNGGVEIRDLICQNRADSGFWKDLKDKYSCTEILFDPKNTEELTRDDLKDVYSYLKPVIGLWGFIVCRKMPPPNILAYNRTLFNNHKQERGVLILTDDDLVRMVKLKLHGKNPAEYVRDRMSEFTRGI
jgi:hypothetical protein